MNAPTTDDTEISSLTTQLKQAQKQLQTGQPVSDIGLHAPRLRGSLDKKTGIAHRLARTLFPNDDTEKVASYIQYGQLLSSLTRAYKEQLTQEALSAFDPDPYKLARIPGNRHIFEDLLEAPLSDSIANPTPMPVEIAPFEDLQPVLRRLEQGRPAEAQCVVFPRGAVYSDGRIDMCKQVVGPQYIRNLVCSVHANSHIQHFLIGNNIVGDEGAEHIAAMVNAPEGSPKLETLYLAGNCITAQGAAVLGCALKCNDTVKSLWLKRNPLRALGVRQIAEMLEENQTIKTLDLVNTAALDEGVHALFKSLRKNTTLRTLYLDANGITVEGVRAIADYFEFLKREKRIGLTGLFLGMNRLGDEGAILLAKALRNYPHMVRLDLASDRIQNAGLKAVLNSAQTLPKLAYLGVGFYKSTTDLGELPNYFDGEGADLIADFIRFNRSVRVLDLKDVNLREDGMEPIVEAVEANPQILTISCSQLGRSPEPKSRQRLLAALRRNLEFQGSDEPVKTQIRHIKHTKSIQHIDSIYRNAM